LYFSGNGSGGFTVSRRDTYHFDIYTERRPGYVQSYYQRNPYHLCQPMADLEIERAFAIRGEPGNIYIRDERWDLDKKSNRTDVIFPTVESAMAWVVATLMIV
jgi:hypothetical protein